MSEALALTEQRGKIRIITLNNPDKYNALSIPLFDQLDDAVIPADADRNVAAIVLAGQERFFAAGADIDEMRGKTTADVIASDFIGKKWQVIKKVQKTVVAAAAGYALGGGCEQLLSCDYIVAAENLQIGLPELTLGTVPGDGGIERMMYRIGPELTLELVMSGCSIDAARALEIGLVDEVVSWSELLDVAAHRAEQRAGKPKKFPLHTEPDFDMNAEEVEALGRRIMEKYLPQEKPKISPYAAMQAIEIAKLAVTKPLGEAIREARAIFYSTFDHPDFINKRNTFGQKDVQVDFLPPKL